MIPLTEKENSRLYEGYCPNCNSTRFLHGPRAVFSENIRCIGCGTEYWFSPPSNSEKLMRNKLDLYHGEFDLHKLLKKIDVPETFFTKLFKKFSKKSLTAS